MHTNTGAIAVETTEDAAAEEEEGPFFFEALPLLPPRHRWRDPGLPYFLLQQDEQARTPWLHDL